MKALIALIPALFALNTYAADATTVLDCVVPNDGAAPVVTLTVDVQEETSADFLTVNLNDGANSGVLFTQLEKGDVRAGLDAGGLGTLVLAEDFGVDNGVIRNSGLLMVSAEQDGSFSGFLSAKGNIYPLACSRK